jgi:hypothetical protein
LAFAFYFSNNYRFKKQKTMCCIEAVASDKKMQSWRQHRRRLAAWALCVGASLCRACVSAMPRFIVLLMFIDAAGLCSYFIG